MKTDCIARLVALKNLAEPLGSALIGCLGASAMGVLLIAGSFVQVCFALLVNGKLSGEQCVTAYIDYGLLLAGIAIVALAIGVLLVKVVRLRSSNNGVLSRGPVEQSGLKAIER